MIKAQNIACSVNRILNDYKNDSVPEIVHLQCRKLETF